MLNYSGNFKLRIVQTNQAVDDFIYATDHTGWKGVLQRAGRKLNRLQTEMPYRLRSRYDSIRRHLPTIRWPKHDQLLPDNPGDNLVPHLAPVANHVNRLHYQELIVNQFIEQARMSPHSTPTDHARRYLHTLATHIASFPDGLPYGPRLDELSAPDAYHPLGFSLTPTDRISSPHNAFTLAVLEQAAQADSRPIPGMPNNLEIYGPNVHVAITRTIYNDYTIDAITPNEGPGADRFWTNLQDAHAEHPHGVYINPQ